MAVSKKIRLAGSRTSLHRRALAGRSFFLNILLLPNKQNPGNNT
jgi:hypothetical protein